MTGWLSKGGLVVVSAATVLAVAAVSSASGKTVIGRVTSFDEKGLTVKARSGETVTVTLGGGTRYIKWVTQKPWQQSTTADRSFLRVGKLVAIESMSGEPHGEARIVRIATD